MRKTLLLSLCLLTAGCGIHYYIKSQTQQFSELAAQVSTEVLKVPAELKELELDVYANLLRADRNCVAINGNILAKTFVIDPESGAIQETVKLTCPKARDTLVQCIVGNHCSICSSESKDCQQLKALAGSIEYCIHNDVARELSKKCPGSSKNGGGLWTTEKLYGVRTDAAANAYVAVTQVASAGASYVSALASLSVDRKEAAEKYVTDTIGKLEKAVAKLDTVAGTDLAPSDEKQKTLDAAKNLLGILKEWSMAKHDADSIRALLEKDGPAFEASMMQLSSSADFLQKTYYQVLLDTETATLTRALRDFKPTTTDGEATEIQKKINELNAKRERMRNTRPISAVISKTIDAHKDLRRVSTGNLSKEEREAVMQENIRQFSRLLHALKDLAATL